MIAFLHGGRKRQVLTIGDGLVSQIPALIVSTAAGLLVTKAGVEGAADVPIRASLSGSTRDARGKMGAPHSRL